MNALLRTALAALWFAAAPAMASDDVTLYETKAPFEDVTFNINTSIVNRGYLVDYHGRIGEMLERTAADVGSQKSLYKNAEIFQFCSAVLSREVMEENIGDIAYCPYIVFAYETDEEPGIVRVGFRHLPKGVKRDKVNALLDEIAREAVGE